MADLSCKIGGRFRTSVFKFRPHHGTRLYDELVAGGADVGASEADSVLARQTGRSQFSFRSDNYSSVDTETLDRFILETGALGV